VTKILYGLTVPVLCLLLTRCGTIGEPVYPSAHIPVAPSDLSAVQRGNRIVAHFTAPAMTTDGQVLSNLGGAEIRVGAVSTPVQPSVKKPGAVDASAPLADGQAGKEVAVSVRVLNSRGRASAWSNIMTIHVIAPVTAPAAIEAAAAPEGIRVTWSDPAEHSFRIFRKGPDDQAPVEAGKTSTAEYVDRNVVWGKPYQYWVQAMRDGAESDAAASPVLTPEDKFPPAVPTGLTAVTGVGSIELAWERNLEADFKTYLVYRALGDAPFEKIGETAAPTYSDKSVVAGKAYRYAVAAADQRGNVSEKCAVVEVVAP